MIMIEDVIQEDDETVLIKSCTMAYIRPIGEDITAEMIIPSNHQISQLYRAC